MGGLFGRATLGNSSGRAGAVLPAALLIPVIRTLCVFVCVCVCSCVVHGSCALRACMCVCTVRDSCLCAAAAVALGVPPQVVVKITGLAAGLTRARARLEDLASEEEQDVECDAGLIAFLLSRSGAAIKQLEADAGVRAKASRDSNKVKLIGAPRAVADAQSWLSTVQDSRVIMTIPVALVPAVIGTKGINFQRIQKEHSVEIDTTVIEESGGDLALTVWGVSPASLEAARCVPGCLRASTPRPHGCVAPLALCLR